MRALPPSLYLKVLRQTPAQGVLASNLVTVLCLRSKVRRVLWRIEDAREAMANNQEVE